MAVNTPRFGASGRALFDAVTGQFQLDVHERELLVQAAHTADTMALLQAQVDKDGPLVRKNFEGPLRANPAAVELRAQRATYMRLIAALGLPAGVVGDVEAPKPKPKPRRSAGPAFEGLRGVSGGGA